METVGHKIQKPMSNFITDRPIDALTVPDIPTVAGEYYENILNMYQTQDDSNYYYYNISNKVVINIANINADYIDYYYLDTPMPLTTLSYRIFGTQHLWWLIVAMNKLNPIDIPPAGTVIVVPKTQYLANVLQTIKQ